MRIRNIEVAKKYLAYGLEKYPDSPIISDRVQRILDEQAASKLEDAREIGDEDTRAPFHEVFGLGVAPEAMTPSGAPRFQWPMPPVPFWMVILFSRVSWRNPVSIRPSMLRPPSAA